MKWFLIWALTASLLILALLLIRRLARRKASARAIYALWLFAALRLLIPGSVSVDAPSVAAAVERAPVVQIADERRTCRQGRCGLTAASWQRLTILVLVAAECALITPLAMKADISRVRIAALLASLCRDAPPTWRMWLARHLRDWRMFPPDGADSTGTERYINTLIRFVDKAMGGSYQEPQAPF